MKRFILLAVLLVACSPRPTMTVDEKVTEEEVEVAKPVHVKVLGFNDLHGHLEGPSGSVMVDGTKIKAGGADHFVARVVEIRNSHRNTVVVSAGDLVGASPMISSLFHDEPIIEAMNIMKLDMNAIGNHEFDEGVDELRRLANGGCHPKDGCQDGDDFAGASFPFLAANVELENSPGKLLFPATMIKEFDGVKVGFIGLTLDETPAIVPPEGIKGVKFIDEIEAINREAATLKSQGIETIIVLIHEGGYPTLKQNDRNECPGISGPIKEIAEKSDASIDAFVTGHTHRAYICEMSGKLVTAAKSYGRLLTEIDLMIDPATGDVIEKSATNLVIDRSGTPNAEVAQLITKYGTLVAPLANKPVGTITKDISRDIDENGESALGKLIADMQLWGTKAQGAQIAFMNSGGVRAPLLHEASGQEGPGVVTYSEAHTVQPFGNGTVTMTFTGAQLKQLLESQFGEKRRILQPSKGFTYTWSEPASGQTEWVDAASMKLDGVVIDPAKSYRITVNSFLSTGGDDFQILNDGTDRVGGDVDLEVFVKFFAVSSPVSPPTDVRVRKK